MFKEIFDLSKGFYTCFSEETRLLAMADCVEEKNTLARVGFEPTRTIVHWNLSPTP